MYLQMWSNKHKRKVSRRDKTLRKRRFRWLDMDKLSNITSSLSTIFAFAALIDSHHALTQVKRSADAAVLQAQAATMPYVTGSFTNAHAIHVWMMRQNAAQKDLNIGVKLENLGASPVVLDSVECKMEWGPRDHIDFNLSTDDDFHSVQRFQKGSVLFKNIVAYDCNSMIVDNSERVSYKTTWSWTNFEDAFENSSLWILASVKFQDTQGKIEEKQYCARYEIVGGARDDDALGFNNALPPDCRIY